MSEPRRLSEGGSPGAQRLLVAARSHRVPERSKQRLLRRAGWYVTIGAWSSGAAAIGKALASTQGAVGVVLAASAIAATYLAVHDEHGPAVPPSRSEALVRKRALPSAPEQAELDRPPVVEARETSAALAGSTPKSAQRPRATIDESAAARPAPSRAQPARDQAEDLRREVEALDSARDLIAGSQPDAALQALKAYEARHPRGRLRLEARVLRVEALARAGRMTEAESLGEAFLRHHPNGFLAERVRRLVGTRSSSP